MMAETFCDLVEGARTLKIGVSAGMIRFQLEGGRAIAAETFRLDSEDVERFVSLLRTAKSRIDKNG